MWRYLSNDISKCYLDVLQDLISAYNRSYLRSIKMKPSEATKYNEHIALSNLCKTEDEGFINIKYEFGDTVKKKAYVQNYTDEYFVCLVDCLSTD